MNALDMKELDARLDKAVTAVSGDGLSPQEKYDLYEQAAIAMLDSEFDDYPEGELQDHLMIYLERKRGEFGVNL